MNNHKSNRKNFKIPIIIGGIALVFGITGFMLEALGWPQFLKAFRSSEPGQGFMRILEKIDQAVYKTLQVAQFEHVLIEY
ncbi:hypothetical protein ACFLRY_02700 [Bacteroidota bacterium]